MEPILEIVKIGDEVLREKCTPVKEFDSSLKMLTDAMFDELLEADGVGLAAPQIGKSIRVVVIDLDVLKDEFPEYENFHHAFINPHIIEIDDNAPKESMEEGCLSIPGIHENVKRGTRIHVKYLDENLQPHDEWGHPLA